MTHPNGPHAWRAIPMSHPPACLTFHYIPFRPTACQPDELTHHTGMQGMRAEVTHRTGIYGMSRMFRIFANFLTIL